MKITNAKTFGLAIRMYRKKQGATQVHLAAIANTGVRFIGDLENGKPTVQLDKALHVAKILGLKIEIPDMEKDDK
ncbi:MAG: helix-turn-helix domain-containing protein [Treponema sp.]|nr:helix-turn-helix domain-containing protein [Treponema sp.]